MSLALDDALASQTGLPTWGDAGPVVYPDYGDTEVTKSSQSQSSHTPDYVTVTPTIDEEDYQGHVATEATSNPANHASIFHALDSKDGSSRRTGPSTKSLGRESNSNRPDRSQNHSSSPSSGGISNNSGSKQSRAGGASADLISQFQDVYLAGHATGYAKGYEARSADQPLTKILLDSAVASLPTFCYYTVVPPVLKIAVSTVSSCLGSVASSLLSTK